MAKKTANDQPDDNRRKEPEELTEAKRDGVQAGREKYLELVREVTALAITAEQIMEIQKWNARLRYNWYSQLVDAGFTPDQAMTLLIHGE